MPSITRESILTLEAYARERPAFRSKIIAHKRDRTVPVGDHVTLIFEDELTIRYQIQEMLRAERIFEEQGILEEIEAYGPLVPDGTNLKATMMIEYADVDERVRALAALRGIETRVWMQAAGHPRVFAIADEDLERSNEQKTAAVHFLRFEFTPAMVAAIKGGAALAVGIDHDAYRAANDPLPASVRDSLTRDLA